MTAYTTANLNNCQESVKVSVLASAVFKERRDKLRVERQHRWLDEVIKKHQVK